MTPKEIPVMETLEEARKCGCGQLVVTKEEKRISLPLSRFAVAARVADRVSQVTVTQAFRNPHPEHLEATYLFPLPGAAAVSDFEMKVGDRILRGKVEERQKARQQYQKAVEQGKRAALLEQERDDVFTVHVGNLPPGEEVEVRIVYSALLPFFEDGSTELRLPLVIAPRYLPGTPLDRDSVGEGVEADTDAVPDASRITPPRLAPGFDPQVSLAIDVDLEEVADLTCSQHASRTSIASGAVRVSLARKDELLDRDFVLRWHLVTAEVRTTLLTCRNGEGRTYGMLSVLPPRRDGFTGVARDVFFVLDRSGSMSGVKMASAARACSLLLSTLGPRDRFGILAFDDSFEWFDSGRLHAADEKGLDRGHGFLRSIDARGGTELDGAVHEALQAIRTNSSGRIPVIVVLTDGQVGDESRILKRIQQEAGDARIFTLGIDTAVNEGFLQRLAALGGGTSAFVVPGDALEEALRAIGREIGQPMVVDLQIDGAEAVTPSRVPDLFAGRAATVFFLAKGGPIRVRGRFVSGEQFETTVVPRETDGTALPQLWARSHVRDLEDRFRLEPQSQKKIQEEILRLSLHHRLLTRFTAFVVVDESEIVNADGTRRKIVQPVHMPARWEMAPESQKLAAPYSVTKAGGPTPFADLSMVFGAMSAAPPPPSELRNGLAEIPSAQEREKVAKELASFAQAFEEARTELAAGRPVSSKALEKAREKLVEILKGSAIAFSLPKLQRFLRTEVVELLAALRQPSAGLQEIFERGARALEEARKELNDPIFWTKSI